jgi:hypothetical protein
MGANHGVGADLDRTVEFGLRVDQRSGVDQGGCRHFI